MYQRLFGLVLLIACALLAVAAWGYHAPFSYEPVGPRAFPLLLLVLLGAGAIYLLVKPASAHTAGDEPPMDRFVIRKVTICVVLLVAYAAVYGTLGFMPASVLFGIGMARLYGGSWIASIIGGVLMGLGLYVLFDRVLDVPLPLGILSSLEI